MLPVGAQIKFGGIPAFDKETIPNLSALACCIFFAKRTPKFLFALGAAEALIAVVVLSPFITSLLNSDPIHIGITYLPGVGPYDALSAAVAQFIYIIPFFLARQYLRRPEQVADILRIMTIAGLLYTVPMLLEVRLILNSIFGFTATILQISFRRYVMAAFARLYFSGTGCLLRFSS